jgi:hypothetical protein
MNKNTLRFGVLRAIAFGAFLAAGAWAGEAAALTAEPVVGSEVAVLWAEVRATLKAEIASELMQSARDDLQRSLVRDLTNIDAVTRTDLITKAAAAASIAPRGFGLVVPALIVDPTQ